jgi:ubiquinone/menaquinone biosynthesis C-methylase UbiE
MTAPLQFDEVAAAQVRAIYETPDVAATRAAVFQAGRPRSGETVLDLGCGPGFLLRDLALAVGGQGRAVGTDISEPMLAMAREHCRGLSQAEAIRADALSLPLTDSSVDLACILQVYAYVKDLDGALCELRRVLKADGRAVILDTDMSGIVWQSRNRPRMERILRSYDGHVAWPDLPRVLPERLARAGLRIVTYAQLPIATLSYHPHTYIHGLARFIQRFVTTQGGIAEQEAAEWLAEFDILERERAFFFSVSRHAFNVAPGGGPA